MFHFGENYFRRSRFHGVFVLLIPFLSKPFWTKALVRIYVCGVWRFPVIRSLASEISLSPGTLWGFFFSETFLPTEFSDPKLSKIHAFSNLRNFELLPSEILAPSGKFVYSNLAHRKFPFAKLLFIHSLVPARFFLISRNRGFAIPKPSFRKIRASPSVLSLLLRQSHPFLPQPPLLVLQHPAVSNNSTLGSPRLAETFVGEKVPRDFPLPGPCRSPSRVCRHSDTRP